MKISVILMAAACALVALGGCSSSKKGSAPASDAVTSATPFTRYKLEHPEMESQQPASFMPKAVIYKTSGDFNENVPVQLGPRGNIMSYPAPTDVSPERSQPIPLARGFLLDRRGISLNTAFTRYTYAQYAALDSVPTQAQLRASIIPDATVTAMYFLPMTPAEAAADTAAVNTIILYRPQELTAVEPAPGTPVKAVLRTE